jgi:DNA-directed RNA polymerase subunit RPC12/RpoP
MARYNYLCKNCSEKFLLEVTKEIKPELICPKCGSHNIKQDYDYHEVREDLEDDHIRCYCAAK